MPPPFCIASFSLSLVQPDSQSLFSVGNTGCVYTSNAVDADDDVETVGQDPVEDAAWFRTTTNVKPLTQHRPTELFDTRSNIGGQVTAIKYEKVQKE